MLRLRYIYLGKLRQVLCVIPSILTKRKPFLLSFPKGWMSHLEGTPERWPYLHQPCPYPEPYTGKTLPSRELGAVHGATNAKGG